MKKRVANRKCLFLSGVQKELQNEAIIYLKVHQQMTNVDYQRVARCPPRTATRDLNLLAGKRIVELRGKGRGAHYVLLKKRARNAPNTPTTVEE